MKDTDKEKQPPASKFITIKSQRFKLVEDNTANCKNKSEMFRVLREELTGLRDKYGLLAVGIDWNEGKYFEAELIDRNANPDVIDLVGHIGKIAVPACGPMGMVDEDADPTKMDIDSLLIAHVTLNTPVMDIETLSDVMSFMMQMRKDLEEFVRISFTVKEIL